MVNIKKSLKEFKDRAALLKEDEEELQEQIRETEEMGRQFKRRSLDALMGLEKLMGLISLKITYRDKKGEITQHTITSRDRFGLVTVHGQDYAITDIGMRMLTPRELYRAQGFPDIVDEVEEEKKKALWKSQQKKK
jgi:site-specific DNA-cytosine methylase